MQELGSSKKWIVNIDFRKFSFPCIRKRSSFPYECSSRNRDFQRWFPSSKWSKGALCRPIFYGNTPKPGSLPAKTAPLTQWWHTSKEWSEPCSRSQAGSLSCPSGSWITLCLLRSLSSRDPRRIWKAGICYSFFYFVEEDLHSFYNFYKFF